MDERTCNLLVIGKEDDVNLKDNKDYIGLETSNRWGNDFTVEYEGKKYTVGYDNELGCYFLIRTTNYDPPVIEEDEYLKISEKPEDIINHFR